jgi:pyruvate kinase
MVARGDLAVETSPEVVPLLQKKIIAAAVAAQKPVITATQMLQSMIESPRPTRAEASDVANAILDGSDALMLSAESAVGQFPVESVSMMARIICSTEESSVAAQGQPALWLQRQTGSCDRALAEAARFAAEEIGAGLIVVFTESGGTARSIAALRPRQRIIAFTSRRPSFHQLTLSWGVEPTLIGGLPTAGDEMLTLAGQALLQNGLAQPGETIVVVTGSLNASNLSNSMKIHQLS